MISHFAKNAKFKHAWVPLPIGPSGKRATILNGLADSIWAGSKVKEAAWQWVKFLGSEACQNSVAKQGVIFPAVNGQAEISISAMKSRGSDASAFLTMTQGFTLQPPIVAHGAEINNIVGNTMEEILIGRRKASEALRIANSKVNTLLSK
jgi:multiple sugar transport system substrate-binding protein